MMMPASAVASPPGLTSGLRGYLYFTASVTGAAIMIVEILGARMLAPYIGSSHFVWTAQIAVTLVALAGGYYAGGRLVDRWPSLSPLYATIAAAAGWLVLSVIICEPVAYWSLNYKLALGSLLTSLILFFLPLGWLAMTGPFLVRMITASVVGVGGNVGRLSAIGTLGSFGGTLLIGYLLLPLLPNRLTMLATAAILWIICAGYFGLFQRQWLIAGPLALGGASVCGLFLMIRQPAHYNLVIERFRGNSHFGEIQVLDRRQGTVRYFLNDNLIQNAYDYVQKQSPLSFTHILGGLPRLYSTNIHDVLVIGMGVGIVPLDFARRGARVDAIEINPAVIPLAEKFFDFDPTKVAVTIGDGRHFLNRTSRQYDVVILDAFVGDSFPSHLMTRETFASIKKLLRSGGSLVAHSFGDLEPGSDFLLNSLAKTLRTEFAGLRIHSTGEGDFFFVARHEPEPRPVTSLPLDDVHPAARKEVEDAFSRTVQIPANSGIVLTDNYNPVDYFDAHNREALRRRLALTAKKM